MMLTKEVVKGGKGSCEDGYTKEASGPEGVRIPVATNAKPNRYLSNPLDRQFFTRFMDVLTRPQNSGRFSFTTQFPYYKQILHKPDLQGEKKLGKNVVFDMDLSAGDFLALLYLLKLHAQVINLKCTDEEVERSYEEFYEDVHTEFLKYGEIVNFKDPFCLVEMTFLSA